MDRARWEAIQRIFAAVAEAPEAEREPTLAQLCGGDAELRREVESLLIGHDRPGRADQIGQAIGWEAQGLAGNPLALRRTVGRYQVTKPLGAGGMGVVFEARDPQLDRVVAIKLLSPALSVEPTFRKRFLAEARLAATLDHPNICTVLDFGESDEGLLYLVMPRYEGETLAARLERGPLPAAEAVAIVQQVALALEQAHGAGVIHRDIKPGNIFVTRGGGVKLLDFGIAKSDLLTTTAAPGRQLGTIAYMSPEQVGGGPVDHRTDLFSLGVVLYQSVVGQHPFGGDRPAIMLAAIEGRPPTPPGTVRAGLDPRLTQVLGRALEKAPGGRYQTAAAFATALGELEPGRPPAGRPPAPRRLLVVASVALAVATVAFVASRLVRSSPRATTPMSVAVLPFENLGSDTTIAYFGSGIADELTTALSRLRSVRVASRLTAFAIHEQGLRSVEAGRRLKVESVVSGTVRRSGERLRISAELVRVADGASVWTDSWEHPMGDLFGVQDSLTLAIVAALAPRLIGSRSVDELAPRGTTDPVAYDLYLRGLYLRLYQRGGNGLHQAADYFQRAVARDPGFAKAHAYLGSTLSDLPVLEGRPSDSLFRLADAELRRALQLDSSSVPILAAVANHAFNRLDFAESERLIRRALLIDPDDARLNHLLGEGLGQTGRHAEAVVALRRAMSLDSLDAFHWSLAGYFLVLAGHPAEGLSAGEFAASLDSTDSSVPGNLAIAYLHVGRVAEAEAGLARAARLDSLPAWLSYLGYIRGRRGDRAGAEAMLRLANGRRPAEFEDVATLLVSVGLGDTSKALAALERIADRKNPQAAWVVFSEPTFDPIRSSPRFAGALTRLGFDASRFRDPVRLPTPP